MSESALWRVATRTALFVVGLLLTLYLLYLLRAVMVQLLLAVIISAGMTPLVEQLAPPGADPRARWWTRGLPRPLAVLVVYLALLGAIVALGAAVIPPAAAQVRQLGRDAPHYLEEIQRWANGLSDRYPFLPPGLGEALPAQLQASAGQLRGVLDQALVALGLVLEALQGVLNFVFILFLALYLTTDSERIRRYFISFISADRRRQAETVTEHIGERLGGWVRGQIALSAIIGGITLVGLLVIGVPYAVLLALVAAIGEAVPMIGPIISAVPAVIVAFFDSPLKGLLTIGLYIIVQQVENVFVVPKVMERAVSLHPLAVMMALLIGGELYGVTGAILSVPVAAAISVVVNEVRREWRENEYASLETPPEPAQTLSTVEQSQADPGAGAEHDGGGAERHHGRAEPAAPGDQPPRTEVGRHAE
ncbi:MAG TPA: AI-2E family transporter [Chloroflexota bacterium]|nr:AI-2E family transporter [Chloroflexota bacterium]